MEKILTQFINNYISKLLLELLLPYITEAVSSNDSSFSSSNTNVSTHAHTVRNLTSSTVQLGLSTEVYTTQPYFLHIWDAWTKIEWVLILLNVVFSSTFLTTICVILAVNKDLRRVFLLFLTWLFWLTASAMVLFLRLFVGAYHFSRIILDLLFFLFMKMISKAFSAFQCAKNSFQDNPQERLLTELEEAENLTEWMAVAGALDELSGASTWRKTAASPLYEWKGLYGYVAKLRQARESGNIENLMFLLRLCCHRDFCGISNPLLFSEALSGTKLLIEEFTEELCCCLRFVCNSNHHHNQCRLNTDTSTHIIDHSEKEILPISNNHCDKTVRTVEGIHGLITIQDEATQTMIPYDHRLHDLFSDELNFPAHMRLTTDTHLSMISTDIPAKTDTYYCSNRYRGNQTQDDFISSLGKYQKQGCYTSEIGQRTYCFYGNSKDIPPLPLSRTPPSFSSLAQPGATRCSSSLLGSSGQILRFLATLRLSLGRTGLCLSGGGSLAMYHMGVVKTLLSVGCLPRVISGTSGGAIVAGVLAIHNDNELLQEILQPEIVTRYNCRWFPPVSLQVRQFFLRGHMMQASDFEATCQAYYGEFTFREAFLRTGRLVSIVVTPSSRSNSEALVLNCVNTPDVFVWSGVAASCALPGLLPPHELMAKGLDGTPVPFCPIGLKWIDGSISQDIPTKELACLFNVKQVVVSQVNPHHIPFVEAYSRDSKIMTSLEKWLILDIKHRYAKLAKFNMIPNFFGQNISSFWMLQEFEGNVTITPRASLIDWYRMISQPSIEDMSDFLSKGQARTWPHCPRITQMIKVEQTLRKCWADLNKNVQQSIQNSLYASPHHNQNTTNFMSPPIPYVTHTHKKNIQISPNSSQFDSWISPTQSCSENENKDVKLRRARSHDSMLIRKRYLNTSEPFSPESQINKDTSRHHVRPLDDTQPYTITTELVT